MRVLLWEEFVKNGLHTFATAGTTGVFDGVHRGHRELLKRVRAQPALPPAESGYADGFSGAGFPYMESAVVTFRQNPRRVLFPQKTTLDIISLDEKLALFEEEGLNYCILIDFTPEFGAMTGEAFLTVLLEKAAMRYMAVGRDFHCGGNRLSAARIKAFAEKGGASSLPYGGRQVEIIPPVMDGGQPVSSSRIRAALAAGDTALAGRLLGRPPARPPERPLAQPLARPPERPLEQPPARPLARPPEQPLARPPEQPLERPPERPLERP